MGYILELENVCKEYDNFRLQNIHFKIEEGVIMGLIGTNGAGKTTLIQIILGLLQKTGNVKIGGMEIEQFEKETKNMCGFVLDENPFLKPISVIGNARMFGPYYSDWDEEQFLMYCKRFGVNPKKKLAKLSQGTVIKFQLAFALSHNAKLLVFDEPSSGLDPIFRRELMDIMYDMIFDGNRSIIFSTHLTNDLDNVADYITMLHNGEQVFSMSKDELLDRYELIRGKKELLEQIPKDCIVGIKHAQTYSEALIYHGEFEIDPRIVTIRPTIEDIMFYCVK